MANSIVEECFRPTGKLNSTDGLREIGKVILRLLLDLQSVFGIFWADAGEVLDYLIGYVNQHLPDFTFAVGDVNSYLECQSRLTVGKSNVSKTICWRKKM